MEPNNTKDPTIESFKRNTTRWRLATIILGIACVVLVVYAKVQKTIADENMQVAMEAQMKTDACAREAVMQRKLAEEAAMRAREAQVQAENALSKALKK